MSHSIEKMEFLKNKVMSNNYEKQKNQEFYKNCTTYFEHLRKKGDFDYEFEDEYYFTMPAISNH